MYMKWLFSAVAEYSLKAEIESRQFATECRMQASSKWENMRRNFHLSCSRKCLRSSSGTLLFYNELSMINGGQGSSQSVAPLGTQRTQIFPVSQRDKKGNPVVMRKPIEKRKQPERLVLDCWRSPNSEKCKPERENEWSRLRMAVVCRST